MDKRSVDPTPPSHIDMATPTPRGIEFLEPRPINPQPKESKPRTPQGTKINSTMVLCMIIVSTLCSLFGYFIHNRGHGDTSSSLKAKYLLGVDLDVEKLHLCGVNCYFIGPYRVTLDIDKPFRPPQRLDILPWYLQLNPGSKKDTLIATLPRRIPTLPAKRPDNIIKLPENLTPESEIAVDVDFTLGQVRFYDDSVFQAKERKDLRHYNRGTRWVLIKNPQDERRVLEGIPIFNLELSSYEKGFIGWDFISPEPDPYEKPQEPW